MKKILHTLFVLSLCSVSYAQQVDPTDLTEIDKPAAPKVIRDISVRIFTKVDQMPEFPGGMAAMQLYLKVNFIYPEKALKDRIEGKVIAQFAIDKDGSVTDIIIKRGIGGGCDEEALRLIKGMPSWKPGMHTGKPVKVYYTLPIDFKLGR